MKRLQLMPRAAKPLAAALRVSSNFIANSCGIAAVEFALILPVMLLLYIGTVDVTRNVMSSRKVAIVSRTVSDLVSQQPTTSSISATKIATIFSASSSIMAPYSTAPLTITVSSVTIQAKTNGACCDAVVNWSYTQSGTMRTCGSKLTQVSDGTAPLPTTIPSSIINANTQAGFSYSATNVNYLIISDVRYTYQPFFSQALAWITGSFQKTTYMVPRSATGSLALEKPVTVVDASTQSACST